MQTARIVASLKEAAAAAKAGNKAAAREILDGILAEDAHNEHAWLWRAAVAEDRARATHALERVLAINPNNQQASTALAAYQRASAASQAAAAGAAPFTAARPDTSARPDGGGRPELGQRPELGMRPEMIVPERADGNRTMAVPRPAPAQQFAWRCPICGSQSAKQVVDCPDCRAKLSLDDVDAISQHSGVDDRLLQAAVERITPILGSERAGEGHVIAALAYLNMKRSELAVSHLEEAVRLRPSDTAVATALERLKKRKCVMVVDDSLTIRKIVGMQLEKALYRTLPAVDGVEALARLEKMTPDLILLDITMPRMDGYQVCKQIRGTARLKEIPVVMLSGNDGFFDKVKGKMAGATTYLTKPFDPPELLKTLEKYLKK